LQIKNTLVELDLFFKQMEPDIEKITGEERDITTFMKIMRMFNKVSSKQQEMEIKFELMKKTLVLLKKHDEFEIHELEKKFNSTPLRWSNLKSKVTQAKQRLGPTIQEEFNSIVQDLTAFQELSVDLNNEISESMVFQRDCLFEDAHKIINDFNDQYLGLQKKADDLKQLQELLESLILMYSRIPRISCSI
jgi:dynein heavy chain